MRVKDVFIVVLGVFLFSCSIFEREAPAECEEIEDNLWKIYADGIGGANVTVYGKTVVTGCCNYVDVFEYDDVTAWSNTGRISFENTSDEVIDISLFEDELIIGNICNDSGRVVYVYKYNESWVKVAEIYSQYESEKFGGSVDICADHLVVSSGFGDVVVYKKQNNEWVFDSELSMHTDSTSDGRLNNSHVAISDKYIISSKNYEVIISSLNDSVWQFMQKIEPSITVNNQFGYSLDIDSTQAIIGDIQMGEFDGVAYVFNLDGENWVENRILSPISGSNGMCFGTSVGICDNNMIVGTRNTELYKIIGYTHLFPDFQIGSDDKYFSLERNGGKNVAISNEFAVFSGSQCAYIYKYK